jgi:hypothetical protein
VRIVGCFWGWLLFGGELGVLVWLWWSEALMKFAEEETGATRVVPTYRHLAGERREQKKSILDR